MRGFRNLCRMHRCDLRVSACEENLHHEAKNIECIVKELY